MFLCVIIESKVNKYKRGSNRIGDLGPQSHVVKLLAVRNGETHLCLHSQTLIHMLGGDVLIDAWRDSPLVQPLLSYLL